MKIDRNKFIIPNVRKNCMKPGRNELCPCGSGKKYKKCCSLKANNIDEEKLLKSLHTYNGFHYHDYDNDIEDEDDEEDDIDDDDSKYDAKIEEQVLFLRAIHNLRRFVLDKKPHIKEYDKIRKMHGEIVGAMVQYYHDGKFKQKATDNVVSYSKEEVEVHLLESNFDLDTRLGSQSFYDIWIYKTALNSSCITEDFIQSNRYRKPEKMEFLHSMLDSKIGLFEITKVDFDEGYVYIKEIYTGKEFKIIDIGLSGQKDFGALYVYTRIITYHGISFGSGLNFVFTKSDRFIKNHILYHKKNYTPKGEFIRFTQLYNYLCDNPEKDRVITVP